MRISTIIVTTVVVTIGLVIGYLAFVADDGSRELDRSSAATMSAQPVFWRRGDLRVYEFEFDTTLALGLASSPEETPPPQRIAGVLGMRVLDVGRNAITTVFVVRDGSEPTGPSLDSSAPFLASFDRQGRPASFRFMADDRRELTHLAFENLIRAFQIVQAEDPFAAEWHSQELDGTGRHLATYSLGADGRSATKTKRDFEIEDPAEGGRLPLFADPEVRVLRSLTLLRWSPDRSWIDAADVDEAIEIRGTQGQRLRVSLRGSLRAVRWSAAIEQALPGSYEDFEGLAIDMAAMKARADEAEAVIDAADEADFRSRLLHLISVGGRDREALEALAAAIKEQPGLAGVVGLALADPAIPQETTAALAHVLELADNDAAAAQLRAVVDDAGLRRETRFQAIAAIVGLTRPDDAVVASLWNCAGDLTADRDLANGALLALGGVAGNLRRGADPRSERISGRILAELDRAPGAERTALLLTAMGNIREPKFGERIMGLLAADAAIVRAAAAGALRASIPDEAAPILARALAAERSAPVRSALVANLERLDDVGRSILHDIDRVVTNEQDAMVRAAMARLLASRLDEYPEGRRTLLELVRHDPSSSVRRAAAAALRGDR